MIKSIKSVRFPTYFGVNFKMAFMKVNELVGVRDNAYLMPLLEFRDWFEIL